jgi:hypothetical protein
LPAGICGIDSVNEDRAHAGSWHRHRRFRHTNRAGTGNRTSRGPVDTHPFTDVADTPHEGHACGVSLVLTCTTRAPSGSTSTRSTTTPDNPNNIFMIDCVDNSHDHDELRAPGLGATTPTPDYSASPNGPKLPLPG